MKSVIFCITSVRHTPHFKIFLTLLFTTLKAEFDLHHPSNSRSSSFSALSVKDMNRMYIAQQFLTAVGLRRQVTGRLRASSNLCQHAWV